MADSSGNVLMKWVVAAMLIAMLSGANGFPLCNIDSNELSSCRTAVSGSNPPPPDQKCCAVVKRANLPCLCGYKSLLPSLGINAKNALALPSKCGLQTPPGCKAN